MRHIRLLRTVAPDVPLPPAAVTGPTDNIYARTTQLIIGDNDRRRSGVLNPTVHVESRVTG
ncbi:hypothetical protein ABTZ59_34735 [Streptomyces sp. NPDC094034]|uniref:hypothetical protein n=1 Tax=Streptomyces sp. NPDC094034 TaxID=3155309 RepID=UPI003319AF8E